MQTFAAQPHVNNNIIIIVCFSHFSGLNVISIEQNVRLHSYLLSFFVSIILFAYFAHRQIFRSGAAVLFSMYLLLLLVCQLTHKKSECTSSMTSALGSCK